MGFPAREAHAGRWPASRNSGLRQGLPRAAHVSPADLAVEPVVAGHKVREAPHPVRERDGRRFTKEGSVLGNPGEQVVRRADCRAHELQVPHALPRFAPAITEARVPCGGDPADGTRRVIDRESTDVTQCDRVTASAVIRWRHPGWSIPHRRRRDPHSAPSVVTQAADGPVQLACEGEPNFPPSHRQL